MPYYTVKTKIISGVSYAVSARSQADARAKVEFAIEREYVPEGVKHIFTEPDLDNENYPIIGEHVIDVTTMDSRKIKGSNA